MKYYIVDVFGLQKYTGNQLAVVIPEASPSAREMQAIANEFHFSETTFILPDESSDTSFRVRIFTPKSEIPFAGHPVLGTAFIIKNELLKKEVPEIFLNLDVGKIRISFDPAQDIQWTEQIEPSFGAEHNPEKVARMVKVPRSELDLRYPIQSVSTGIEFLIIPMRSLESIRMAATNLPYYREYFQGSNPQPLFLFCPETYEAGNALNTRMFADIFGIPEDPATGSANGCLAAYLSRYEYFGSRSIDITVEQGYEIGRKSILHLKSDFDGQQYHIRVGGKVIKIAEGQLV